MTVVRLKSAHRDSIIAEVEVQAKESVLAAFQRADQPLAAACDGALLCGRCLVTVLEGNEHLRAPSKRERATLKLQRDGQQPGPGPNRPPQRLACCIRPNADLLIEVSYR